MFERALDGVQDLAGGADKLDDVPIQRDIENLLDLLEVFGHGKERRKCGEGEGELDTCFPGGADTRLFHDADTRLPRGADTVTKERAVFPVHRVVLAAWSPVFRRVLAGKGVRSQLGITLPLLATTPTSKAKSKSKLNPTILTHLSTSGCYPFSTSACASDIVQNILVIQALTWSLYVNCLT